MGKGIVNFTVVFKVGLLPGGPGPVFIFSIVCDSGGTKDFTLKLIKAFLIGRIPGDSSDLRPRTSMLTLHSLVGTLAYKSTPRGLEGVHT